MQKMILGPCQDDTLSNQYIIECCHNPNRQIIGGYGNPVVRLSQDVVVKSGQGVSAEEANNQRKALELLDSSIVRVPKVYRYFTWADNDESPPEGFLVMEFIYGDTLEVLNDHQIDQVVQILLHFSRIQGQRPGPFQTGASLGLLWEESGKPRFETTKQMER